MSLLLGITPLKGKAGPFSPSQLPALKIWLDGAASSNFTFASGTDISTWINKGTEADMGVLSVSPTFSAASINGLGAVDFDNSTFIESLGSDTNQVLDTTAGFFATFVMKLSSISNAGLFFAVNTNSGSNQFGGFAVSSNGAYNDIMFNGYDGTNGYPNMRAATPNGLSTDMLNTVAQISFAYDGSGYTGSNTAGFKMWLNGVPLTVTNDAASVGPQIGVNSIGSWALNGNRINGLFGEAIFCGTNLPSAQQIQTMAYANARWGI